MNDNEFDFVGYILQEPYYLEHPEWQGYRVATLDPSLRDLHPAYQSPAFEQIGSAVNGTSFREAPIAIERENDWALCAYFILRAAIPTINEEIVTRDGAKHNRPKYCFALCRKAKLPQDMTKLGYDIIDGDTEYLSILFNCGVSANDCKDMGCQLTPYGLLATVSDAQTFIKSIQSQDHDEPHYQHPVMWEVWGVK